MLAQIRARLGMLRLFTLVFAGLMYVGLCQQPQQRIVERAETNGKLFASVLLLAVSLCLSAGIRAPFHLAGIGHNEVQTMLVFWVATLQSALVNGLISPSWLVPLTALATLASTQYLAPLLVDPRH